MGDPYLLPAIAAVVLGGTSILGGRGSYFGTVAGVILITLLQSILSVAQIQEYGRQVVYGVVIILCCCSSGGRVIRSEPGVCGFAQRRRSRRMIRPSRARTSTHHQ